MSGPADRLVGLSLNAAQRVARAVRIVERRPLPSIPDYRARDLTSVQGPYFCNPAGSISGASGIWTGGGAPSSYVAGTVASITVYQVQSVSGTPTLVALDDTYTIYNWYPAATVAGKVILVEPDGQGNYVVVAQSCT